MMNRVYKIISHDMIVIELFLNISIKSNQFLEIQSLFVLIQTSSLNALRIFGIILF
jgi:hypothetical protein